MTTTAPTTTDASSAVVHDAASLENQITAATRKLDEFRTAVRDEIVAIHQAGTWCLNGSNAALEDLDLSPISYDYTGTVTVTVDVTVHNADSEAIAVSWVERALSVDSDDDDVVVTDTDIDTYRGLSESNPI